MQPLAERLARLSPQQLTLLALELHARLETLEHQQHEPLAIVGIGCRFPGGATSPAAFWRLLHDGGNAICEIPPERWDSEELYDPDPMTVGKVTTRRAGLLADIAGFDAAFFGISPREAASMDPHHRIFLEVAWEAFEDAGLARGHLAGSRTGIFAGMGNQDYAWLNQNALHHIDIYSGTGTFANTLTGRLAYLFDLRGPSVSIDTGCSSSLVAVNLACQSLRARESDIALAGGVNLFASPLSMTMLARMGILAPDGHCKTFDAAANGFARGEGCGLVVLKRLSDAQRDGDTIHALIRGTAINQDGTSASLTAPSMLAQQDVIGRALQDAQLDPAQISYVETHGTGTVLGDPIEVQALTATYGQRETNQTPCLLGAVKTNLGHLEAAAGIAGLIKTVLVLQQGAIPPNLHFERLNPHITLEGTRLAIPTTPQPWHAGEHGRYGAVSSFGWSGTNAHAILAEAPPVPARADPWPDQAYLLPLSAKSPAALRDLAQAYADLLAAEDAPALPDLCYTASQRRTHHPYRLGVVGRTPADLVAALDAAQQQPDPAPAPASPPLAFVFSGQGSHWAGMGQQLFAHEPVFRDALLQCAEVLSRYVDWSLINELQADAEASRLHQTAIAQPAIFAIQVALAALWRSWGVVPAAIVGQSLGEVAAAHVAGALTLDDAVRVVVHRSRLMQRVAGQGATAVVGLPLEQAQQAIAAAADRVGVAGSTSPTSSVLSGDPQALEQILADLAAQGVFARRLNGVDIAFHSPQMDPLVPELTAALATIQPRAATIPLYSTVTGDQIAGDQLGAAYWGRNLRDPFQAAATLASLIAQGTTRFLEVSPHPVLTQPLQELLDHQEQTGLVAGSLRRNADERAALLQTGARLYAAGVPLTWEALAPGGGRVVRLPTYPWQHQRYWKVARDVAAPTSAGGAALPTAGRVGHPLIGQQLRLAGPEPVFSGLVGDHLPFVNDYRYYGRMVLSAATYIEIGVAAARAGLHLTGALDLRNLTIAQALVLPTQTTRELQTRVVPVDATQAEVQVWSSAPDSATHDASAWVLHATGRVGTLAPDACPPTTWLDLPALQQRCPTPIDLLPLLDAAGEKGYEQRASLRGMPTVQRGQHEALGRWEVPPDYADDLAAYHYHPMLLHMCFLLTHVLLDHREGERYVSLQFERCRMLGALSGPHAWCYGRVRPETLDAPVVTSDVWIANADGQVIAVLEGVDLARGNEHTLLKIEQRTPAYAQIAWQPQPLPAAPPQAGHWLILADQHGVARHLAELLTQQGQTAQVLDAALDDLAAVQGLLAQAGPCTGMVHLGSLERGPSETLADLDAVQCQGCISVLHLVQALAETGWAQAPRLVLVTQETQRLAGDTHRPAVAQSPIWGLGRVIQNEHPELCCTLVDIDQDAASLAGLARELATRAPAPEELALRAGARSVARLEPYKLPQASAAAAIQFKSDATYLLTGGLGGIGLALARWMVEHGARHLVLMSRRGITTDAAAQAIGDLRRDGAQVEVASADVTDCDQVETMLAWIETTMPPLRGVFHAAMVLDDGILLQLTRERFHPVLQPKVAGAWNLHQLTRQQPLDYFVLFSAMATLIGNRGQGNYTAANAFLDTLATYRRSQGLPALSINWGVWAEVGVAARSQYDQRAARMGIDAMDPQHAFAALGALLRAGATVPAHLGVAAIDWQQFGKAASPNGVIPLLKNLAGQQERPATRPPQSRQRRDAAAELRQTSDPARRQQMVVSYMQEEVARALSLPPAHLDLQQSLQALGMDSLLSLELKRRIEADLSIALPVQAFMSGQGLAHLAQLAVAQLNGVHGTSPQAPAPEAAGGPTAALARSAEHPASASDPHLDGRALPALALPPSLHPVFGQVLPHATLLHVATPSPLLVLQSGGVEPPCVLVHAGFGDVLSYLPLARHLGTDRPVYAIQAPDPREAPTVYTSIAAMSAAYLDLIQAHQPTGPYLLCGWSFGGTVALEMARQLWRQGQPDITLVLLDTWLVGDRPIARGLELVTALFVDRIAHGFGLDSPIPFAHLCQQSTAEQVQLAWEWGMQQHIFDPAIGVAYLQDAVHIIQATMRLLEGYKPAPYPGLLHVFRAAGGMPLPYQQAGFTVGHQAFTADELVVATAPGDHTTMLQEPHVAVLAEELRGILRHTPHLGR